MEEALRNADSQNNLRLKISLADGKPAEDTSLTLAPRNPNKKEGKAEPANTFDMEALDLEPK